ncbi:MAG: hypothetical protein J0L62_01425 [Bacteroidetes bacterium]|nr:hypothetical protein [Bacteroidota bacterium]
MLSIKKPESYTDVVLFLNNIETQFPVHIFTVNGIDFWPLIRVQFGYQLHLSFQLNEVTPTQSAFNNSPFFFGRIVSKGIKLVNYMINSFQKKGTQGVKIAGFGFNSHRIKLSGFNTVNPFIEPVLVCFKKMGFTVLYWESDIDYKNTRIPLVPINSPNHNNAGPVVFSEEIVDLFVLHLNELKQFLELKTPDLMTVFAKTNFVNQIKLVVSSANEYFQLLSIDRPGLVLMYNYYNAKFMGLSLASHELGIPTMDIQHSAISNQHFAYGPWTSLSENGSALLPDLFWVWRKSDFEIISNGFTRFSPRYKAFHGGNQWISFWKSRVSTPKSSFLFKKTLSQKLNLLVCLQGIGIPDFLIEFIAKYPGEYKWFFRFHPRYPGDKSIIHNLQGKGIDFETEFANSESLYSIFPSMDYTLTFTSGTAIESAEFGVPVIILGNNGFKVYNKEIKSGKFLFANSIEDITGIFKNRLKPEPLNNSMIVSNEDTRKLISKLMVQI